MEYFDIFMTLRKDKLGIIKSTQKIQNLLKKREKN